MQNIPNKDFSEPKKKFEPEYVLKLTFDFVSLLGSKECEQLSEELQAAIDSNV